MYIYDNIYYTYNIYVFIILKLLWGTGSYNYGGQKVPQSAICKLKTQESQWYNSVQVQKPETRGDNDLDSSVKARENKVRCLSSVSEASIKDEFLLPSIFFICSGSQQTG